MVTPLAPLTVAVLDALYKTIKESEKYYDFVYLGANQDAWQAGAQFGITQNFLPFLLL